MTYDIDVDVLNFKIIPLIIEPLVENAMRYGILKNIKGGRVKLNIKKRYENIFVCIEDNGKGISEFQIQEINRDGEIEKNEFQGNGISLININY